MFGRSTFTTVCRRRPIAGSRLPVIWTCACNFSSQILTDDAAGLPGLVHSLIMVEIKMCDSSLLRPMFAQVPRQSPGVDSLDRNDFGFHQCLLKGLLAPPITDKTTGFHH